MGWHMVKTKKTALIPAFFISNTFWDPVSGFRVGFESFPPKFRKISLKMMSHYFFQIGARQRGGGETQIMINSESALI